MAIVKLWTPNELTICSVYITPDHQLTSMELTNLVDQLPVPYILVGDFNAHSQTWGSYKLDQRGKIVEDMLGTHNIVLLNTGQWTHLDAFSGRSSTIDLSFCDPQTASALSWEALDSLYGSDNYPILISTENPKMYKNLNTSKSKLKSAD